MIKNFTVTISSLILLLLPLCLNASQGPPPQALDIEAAVPTIPGLEDMDTQDFMRLNPRELKKMGIELSLRDRLVLRQVQYQVHRKLKKGEAFDLEELYTLEDRRFSIGGFLLGFFFSLIGVLIAILFGRDAVRSALYGALTSLIIGLIIGASA
jgi:hypothetical protein